MEKLSYETCKRLKDIGFPQNESGTHIFPSNETVGFKATGDAVYCPSLSELVEKVGEHGEFRLSKKSVYDYWRAFANDTTSIFADGKTAEEATAELYIVLNSPQNA